MNAKTPVTMDLPRTMLGVLSIGMLIAASFRVLLPFLTAMIPAPHPPRSECGAGMVYRMPRTR
jgi:hypothetical protein